MRAGTNSDEAASGTRPRSMKGVLNVALGVAKTRSQCNSNVVPTPIAAPSTAATSGFCVAVSAFRKGKRFAVEFTALGGREKIAQIIAGRKSRLVAQEQVHAHLRVGVARCKRLGQRAIHGAGDGVLLLRPIESQALDAVANGPFDPIAHDAHSTLRCPQQAFALAEHAIGATADGPRQSRRLDTQMVREVTGQHSERTPRSIAFPLFGKRTLGEVSTA